MQFHLNGFRAGDPHIKPPIDDLPEHSCSEVDVLIIGCGPAGLTLAAQLSAFANINTRIIERKAGPLELGQADGLACRTLEMFEAFGFSERVIREAYNVVETVFWSPDDTHPEHILRSGRIQDVEDDLPEFPHLILNQARVHDRYLEFMQQSPRRLRPDYEHSFLHLDDADDSCVQVTLENSQGKREHINAKYVVGCDGARSEVRQAIGLKLHGDSANQAWGVMDVLAVTDFPDIRFKAIVRSAGHGNIIIIPREGGYLVRLYIEMDKLAPGERVASRNIQAEHLISAAQRIFRPYSFVVKEMVWWSVYEIGQRLCDRFDNAPADRSIVPRVFIAGDACHTHSPKAGQGMNVSMADAFNLGWKLAAVLRGRSDASLLHTYSMERQQVTADLIDFDKHWASRFSETTRNADHNNNSRAMDATEFQTYFTEHGRYTAGVAVQYQPSVLVADNKHQSLAGGLSIGMRFHSAVVTRVADALPMHLGHTIKADGRWRLFIFANTDNPASSDCVLWRLCDYLQNAGQSPLQRYQQPGDDPDAVIDCRVVLQQSHSEVNTCDIHPLLMPVKGRLELRDTGKVFSAVVRQGADIFDKRQISRDGCMVIVRPDQFVADVMPLGETHRLSAFFNAIFP
ncbi:MAG: FAD-dependent monooxygenase [Pseudomonadota bacterium]